MKTRFLLPFVVVALLMAVSAVAVTAGGRPLTAELTGAAEVPGPGDPDGSGVMKLTLNSGQEEICFDLEVKNIEAPTRAHIHVGDANESGSVVVFFFDTVIPNPIPVPEDLAGCVDVPRALVKEIRQNPAEFYINIHNGEYPGGAIRGQLSK